MENVICPDFEMLAVLYAADELDGETRAAVEGHASRCAGCAATLATELRLREAIGAQVDDSGGPDPLLLARCRHELAGAIEDLPTVGQSAGWRNWLSPDRWMAAFRHGLVLRPGWTAAALLVAGALGGTAVGRFYRAASFPMPGSPAMTVSAAPSLTEHELETMGVEGVRVKAQGDDSAPQVEVQLRSNKPMMVEGTPDDAEVRRVLSYVVEHGQKFDPGVRLDSVEVLRASADDPRVRAALCAAARQDGNPAVRLKALAALHGAGSDPQVQQTILAALGDDNSGVRIEAINALLATMNGMNGINGMKGTMNGGQPAAMPMPPQALEVLRDREHNDSNSYVRQRSARVLSQLASFGDGGGDSGDDGSGR